jgi:hypothetical protein
MSDRVIVDCRCPCHTLKCPVCDHAAQRTAAADALEAADRQAALAAELERVKEALLEFIHAYANVERLDHDGTEVELFTAWIRGCAALGIKAEGYAALDTTPAVAPGASDAGEGERSCR